MASHSESPSHHRSRPISRSPTPMSQHSRSPPRHRQSPSGGRSYRSPSPRRDGRYREGSRSLSPSRSRSWSRDRESLPRSRTPSEGPPLRSTKIVVERLTKNVNEDHLYEIFGQYGEIKDLDLPINRQYGTNRGTAYILYMQESGAEAAIAHMHEAQLDGATINVSVVLPRRKFSPPPPVARRGANYDPRLPPPGPRGRGRRPSPPGAGASRYGPRSDTYRPRTASHSPSHSPPPPPGGGRRRRSRSASYSSRSRSRTPPVRGHGRGRRHDGEYDGRRRSPSHGSYDSYDRRSPSRSRSRDWDRR